MDSLKNKRGFIKIDQFILREMSMEHIKLVFSNFYPISIDNNHLFMDGRLAYYGYSEHFEEVDSGCQGNEYNIIITIVKNGTDTITFKKVEE